MRLRLFEIGLTNTAPILRIDRFPASLSLSAGGEPAASEFVSLQFDRESGNCHFEDIGGQIMVHAHNTSATIGINETAIESGPLLPGDRFRLGEHAYVVSYERTAKEQPPEPKIVIQR